MKALEHWRRHGPPDQPTAWLFRVAYRHVIDELRAQSRRHRLLAAHPDSVRSIEVAEPFLAGEIPDDLLAMMFVCCDPRLPAESQLVLALKTLGGFSVREIAARRFTTEANVYKRLARARASLREAVGSVDGLDHRDAVARRPAVQHVLYLLFTEGYLSSHATLAIRQELCDEAIRLGEVLAEHEVGQTPETFALMALMHLHRARLEARQNEMGELRLLDEQDRSQWDRVSIGEGMAWLVRSAEGDTFSRYHAEARIAAAHALAPTFEATRWDEIVQCYELLERIAPSPLHRLNRAVAVAEWQGPERGLEVLGDQVPPTWLAGSYLWSAVLADLHRRCGHLDVAEQHHARALASAPSEVVRQLLVRRANRASGRLRPRRE